MVRYRASDGKSEVDLDPLIIFHKAVQNAKPIMGTTTIRRGGKRYYVRNLYNSVQLLISRHVRVNYKHWARGLGDQGPDVPVDQRPREIFNCRLCEKEMQL